MSLHQHMEIVALHPSLIVLTRRRTRQAEASHVLMLLKNAREQGLANNINFA